MNINERIPLSSRLGVSLDETLILSTAHTAVLAAAARGEIDLNRWAREELASRGVDLSGKWIGFDQAAKLHGVAA